MAEYYLRSPVLKQEYGQEGERERMALFAGVLLQKGEVHMGIKGRKERPPRRPLRQVWFVKLQLSAIPRMVASWQIYAAA